jgi:hypothetical protein
VARIVWVSGRPGLRFVANYLRDNPGKAAHLLHEDGKLPTTSGEAPLRPGIETKEISPPGAGMGAT